MATVTPNPTQGANLLAGTQSFYSHDDAADNKSGGVYSHRAEEFSATEAESWCDFFRAVKDAIATAQSDITSRSRWRGVSAGAPGTPVGGDLYKNSGDSKVYIYDGTSWIALT